MRHRIKGRKLNRTSAHRKAMFANMAVSLLMNEQIKTTLPKAKEIRPYVEKLITAARSTDLAVRRRLIAKIKDRVAVEKLLTVLAPRYESRSGGYTRIIKAGFRFGDMAPVAYIELLDRDVSAKGKSDKLSSKAEVTKENADISSVKEKKAAAAK